MLSQKSAYQPSLTTIPSLTTVIALGAGLLVLAPVVLELRKPSQERTWHGTIGGIPYDFRRPTLARLRSAWWDPSSNQVFTARDFGIGWAINLPAFFDRVRAFAS